MCKYWLGNSNMTVKVLQGFIDIPCCTISCWSWWYLVFVSDLVSIKRPSRRKLILIKSPRHKIPSTQGPLTERSKIPHTYLESPSRAILTFGRTVKVVRQVWCSVGPSICRYQYVGHYHLLLGFTLLWVTIIYTTVGHYHLLLGFTLLHYALLY